MERVPWPVAPRYPRGMFLQLLDLVRFSNATTPWLATTSARGATNGHATIHPRVCVSRSVSALPQTPVPLRSVRALRPLLRGIILKMAAHRVDAPTHPRVSFTYVRALAIYLSTSVPSDLAPMLSLVNIMCLGLPLATTARLPGAPPHPLGIFTHCSNPVAR